MTEPQEKQLLKDAHDVLAEVLAALKREAPGTPLNNQQYVQLGLQAHRVLNQLEAAGTRSQPEPPKPMGLSENILVCAPELPTLEKTARHWTEVLCTKCGGNGVCKIHHGVETCPRCQGRCYEPEQAPEPSGVPALDLEKIHRYTITSEGASAGYFRLIEDKAGAWVQWAEVDRLRASLSKGKV